MLNKGTLLANREGFPYLANPKSNTELQRLLSRALQQLSGQSESASMIVRQPSSTRPTNGLALHVTPVSDREAGSRTWVPSALLPAIEPRAQGSIDRSVLIGELGLSKAESEVAALVAERKSIPEVTAAIGRNEHTVRWHIKQALAKLGVLRQAELAQIVRAIAGILPESHPYQRPD